MWIFFAVLLAVSQASPPVPRQAANNPTSTSRPADDQPKANGGIPSQPEATVNPVNPKIDEKPAEKVAGDDASKAIRVTELPPVPITRDWIDHLNWFFTLLLVIVGSVGIWVANKTLKTIRDQAAIMLRQTVAAEIAANAARDNVEAAAANARAAEEAATASKEGALAAKANAEAASRNAGTAKEQVEMFISKERARLRVEMIDLPAGRQLSLASASGAYEVKFKIVLYGQTDAFIVRSGINVYWFDDRPDKISFVEYQFFSPMWNLPDVISPTKRVIESSTFFLPDEGTVVFDTLESKGKVLIFYGFIEYTDVFDRQRETWFRYLWEVDQRIGDYWGRWVKDGPPQDNRHT